MNGEISTVVRLTAGIALRFVGAIRGSPPMSVCTSEVPLLGNLGHAQASRNDELDRDRTASGASPTTISGDHGRAARGMRSWI